MDSKSWQVCNNTICHDEWRQETETKGKDVSRHKHLHSRSMSTINPKISTSHETASARQQEHSRRFEVLGRSETSKQGAGHPGFLDFWLGGEESVGHCCADVLESTSVSVGGNGKKGKLLTPGDSVLMRMPWTPISCAMDLQSWCTAALLVL
jgi:hypothetical protein